MKDSQPEQDEDDFGTEFKELLKIAGDDHDLKRAVVRVGKAHTMATVVYKDSKDSNGITQSMWLWRYINDVSMLLKLLGSQNKGVDTLRERVSKQEQIEIEQELWLRQRLNLLRFPSVDDVYVANDYYFYVTFSRLLSTNEIMLAGATINATIERTPQFRNRYRVVFEAPDKEED